MSTDEERNTILVADFPTKECLELVLCGRSTEVGSLLKKNVVNRLYQYVPEALRIWEETMETISSIEKQTHFPYFLIEKPKLYALDGIVVADSLGIQLQERVGAMQAFSVYYLAVHLLDDLIEDPTKFMSKFACVRTDNEQQLIRALGASFVLHASIACSRVLISNSNRHISDIEEFTHNFMASLATQIKYFLLEKSKEMSPYKTLEIKQHHVAGEATSFIADCLEIDKRFGQDRYNHIKKALFYLGSLTQFTDDLRDYEIDSRNGNANLLINMKRHFGAKAKDAYSAWYLREEQLVLMELEQAGLTTNTDLILAIPWYPFFMKRLTK